VSYTTIRLFFPFFDGRTAIKKPPSLLVAGRSRDSAAARYVGGPPHLITIEIDCRLKLMWRRSLSDPSAAVMVAATKIVAADLAHGDVEKLVDKPQAEYYGL
jgi:hypothetical protein